MIRKYVSSPYKFLHLYIEFVETTLQANFQFWNVTRIQNFNCQQKVIACLNALRYLRISMKRIVCIFLFSK